MVWFRLLLILAAGSSVIACSQKPLHGDTNYETTEKIFGPEMTPAQRESAIKELQSETKKQ
jgi:hypothetical protein